MTKPSELPIGFITIVDDDNVLYDLVSNLSDVETCLAEFQKKYPNKVFTAVVGNMRFTFDRGPLRGR